MTCWPNTGAMTEQADLQALRAEKARLVALLESHGIAWRNTPTAAALQAESTPRPQEPLPASAPPAAQVGLTTAEKVALFRRLFRGRTDVYPVRWENKTLGKSGYAPACANEWQAGVCEELRIKCGDCGHRLLAPLSDAVIYDHLAGKRTVGVYPLLEDDTCHFLVVDLDEADSEAGGWQQDAQAFMRSCDELGVLVALEISRSGQGTDAWVFFGSRVSAPGHRPHQPHLRAHPAAQTGVLRPLVSQPG